MLILPSTQGKTWLQWSICTSTYPLKWNVGLKCCHRLNANSLTQKASETWPQWILMPRARIFKAFSCEVCGILPDLLADGAVLLHSMLLLMGLYSRLEINFFCPGPHPQIVSIMVLKRRKVPLMRCHKSILTGHRDRS